MPLSIGGLIRPSQLHIDDDGDGEDGEEEEVREEEEGEERKRESHVGQQQDHSPEEDVERGKAQGGGWQQQDQAAVSTAQQPAKQKGQDSTGVWEEAEGIGSSSSSSSGSSGRSRGDMEEEGVAVGGRQKEGNLMASIVLGQRRRVGSVLGVEGEREEGGKGGQPILASIMGALAGKAQDEDEDIFADVGRWR
jgi:hypothetical protein